MKLALRLILIIAGFGFTVLAIAVVSALPGMSDVVAWTIIIVSFSLIVSSVLHKLLSKKG